MVRTCVWLFLTISRSPDPSRALSGDRPIIEYVGLVLQISVQGFPQISGYKQTLNIDHIAPLLSVVSAYFGPHTVVPTEDVGLLHFRPSLLLQNPSGAGTQRRSYGIYKSCMLITRAPTVAFSAHQCSFAVALPSVGQPLLIKSSFSKDQLDQVVVSFFELGDCFFLD